MLDLETVFKKLENIGHKSVKLMLNSNFKLKHLKQVLL